MTNQHPRTGDAILDSPRIGVCLLLGALAATMFALCSCQSPRESTSADIPVGLESLTAESEASGAESAPPASRGAVAPVFRHGEGRAPMGGEEAPATAFLTEERARETMPDVILMDINMPRCSGLEATLRIKGEMPHVKIIMLTVSDDDKGVFAAIKNGADGYILKDVEPYQLFDYLEGTRRGEAAISGRLAARILQEYRHPEMKEAQSGEALETLTPKEVEILEQLVRGASNRDIAAALFISENTVKIHVRNILEKLHLQNRIQAAVYAVRQGIVSDTGTTE